MKKQIKVAQVGLGYIAQAEWLPFVSRLPNLELVAVVDVVEELAATIGRKLRVDYFTSLGDCLAKCDMDAVFITASTISHADLITKSAEHGKHILVEKPLTEYIPDATECVKAAEKADVKLMVAYMRRHDSDCLRIKELVENDEIGKINTAISWVNQTYPSVYTQIFTPPKQGEPIGPGAQGTAARRIWGMTTHHIDLLRFWLGEAGDVLFARATEGSAPFVTIFEIGDGVVATHQTFDSSGQGEYLWLHGEYGSIQTRLWSPHMPYNFAETAVFKKNEKTESRLVIPRLNMYESQIKHFVECIQEDKEPRSTGEDSLKNLELAAKIIQKMGLELPLKGQYSH